MPATDVSKRQRLKRLANKIAQINNFTGVNEESCENDTQSTADEENQSLNEPHSPKNPSQDVDTLSEDDNESFTDSETEEEDEEDDQTNNNNVANAPISITSASSTGAMKVVVKAKPKATDTTGKMESESNVRRIRFKENDEVVIIERSNKTLIMGNLNNPDIALITLI